MALIRLTRGSRPAYFNSDLIAVVQPNPDGRGSELVVAGIEDPFSVAESPETVVEMLGTLLIIGKKPE